MNDGDAEGRSWRRLPLRALRRMAKLIDIDPSDVLRDARSSGLAVEKVEDFRQHASKYWRIQDVATRYITTAARNSAASGLTAGAGGPFTMVSLGAADLANMATQLYRLNQRLAILHGFDPSNPSHREAAQNIYLASLGFDTAAQAALRGQLSRAASIAGKRGAYSNPVLRLIVAVSEKIGPRLTSAQAAKFIPLVGAVAGATVNYLFAKAMGKQLAASWKDEYFRTWQASQG